MNEAFKAMIWPYGSKTVKTINDNKPIYRYYVIGVLMTDEPIKEFEGKNEVVVEGTTFMGEITEVLTRLKSRAPSSRWRNGTANQVLMQLREI